MHQDLYCVQHYRNRCANNKDTKILRILKPKSKQLIHVLSLMQDGELNMDHNIWYKLGTINWLSHSRYPGPDPGLLGPRISGIYHFYMH